MTKGQAEPADFVDLEACATLPVEWVGGKVAALGRLHQQGFVVPPGFVVTSAVARVTQAAGGVLPEPLRRALVKRWRQAGWKSVAVRSSGVLEDRPDVSLAGQLETVLDVHDGEGLVRAVEQVMASARSARVRAYLQRRLPGADTDRLVCACLIQLGEGWVRSSE